MGFTDALKRSLGFEEDTSLHNKQQNNYRRPSTPSSDFRMSNNNASDLSSHSYYDDVSISPEQSFYEIMLIRPKTIDDINYVVDQVLEESNPVILDLSFLEKESPANFSAFLNATFSISVFLYPNFSSSRTVFGTDKGSEGLLLMSLFRRNLSNPYSSNIAIASSLSIFWGCTVNPNV